MNKLQKLLLQHEKRLKYALVVIGISFIIIGISIPWLKELLIAIGNSYAEDGSCCLCYKYIGLHNVTLIIIGCFLSFAMLFEKHSIKLYEKYIVKPKTILLVLLVLIFISLGIISYFTFHNFPYSYDEYNYLYQANIYSQGKLFIEVPEIFRPFKELYMILKDNKLFSKYPPGFPIILTFGVLLNISGIINPLIAALTLIILYYFTKSFLGPKYGLLSVIIVSTTPYFLGYSASYYSQPTALLFTALIFLLVRRYELTSNKNYLFLIGLASGYSFMTRPLDSFCALVPSYLYLIYILIYKKEKLRNVSIPILTFSMLFALFISYNYFLIGKISIATYPIVEGEFKIVDPNARGFLQNIYSIGMGYINNGIRFIPRLLYKFFLVHTGFFIPLFAIFGIFNFKSKWKWVLIANFLMLIIFYNFHNGPGWPQYGARYYYSGFISLAILATASFKQLIENLNKKNQVMYLVVFILCVNFVFSYILFSDYSYRFKIKLALIENIKKKCPDNSIVILDRNIDNSVKPDCPRKVSLLDLGSEKRNMFMNTPRLITYNSHLDLSQIKSHFPNHSICNYNYRILNKLRSYEIASQ
jgi:4-amino-4-deoxy-L-arabinose transferase-like glycosyltransferase